jgi:WASH complex subunit strumpellin
MMQVLSRTVRDDNLRMWFESIAAEVGKLEGAAPMVAGRKIQQLINALEEVESFHQFGPSLQTKQYLVGPWVL